MGDNVDRETIIKFLKDLLKEKSDILPTADVIIDEVCKFYNIEPELLRGQGRAKDISQARQIAMYLLSEELHLSTTKIATEVGVKDHTTVLHGINKIKNDFKLNFVLREQINEIRSKIYD